jgi:hypothetical protein
MYLASNYMNSNKNNWTYWRGSDGLVYIYTMTNNASAPVVVQPWADCNTDDGTCQFCTNASGQRIYNCCQCSNVNIDKLVNYPNPQGSGTVNLCEPYGIKIDENGCSVGK